MYFESRDQKYPPTGRFASALIGRAAENGSFARFTQIFLTPLYGFRKEIHPPSGEISAPAICTSPKNALRSISGGCCARQSATKPMANIQTANTTERRLQPSI